MKLVTYNVNGLRPRIAQNGGSLLKFLNSLEADIICLQETKLSRDEVTADLIMAEGYESFFSCTSTSGRGRLGYSGVATFCRVNSAFSSNEVALPVAAEEGFTGLLEHCRRANSTRKDFLLEVSTKVDGLEGFTNEDLLKVDSEGRCIITDHGHFVLFNIYGPRADPDDTERVDFKLNFFKILQKRWESYFRQGKRVFVVGDLNIAPYAVDRCEADQDFERNQFRTWLRSLLVENGGPFFDVFRAKHPRRNDAYTCWSMESGAEEFNFGSRIDHILLAGSCLHHNDMDGHSFMNCHITDCDIMTQFKRWKPGNIHRWKGGKNIKLEGSDHAPVYASLRELPDLPVHNTPSLAARYVSKVRGCQQSIVNFLSKRQVNAQVQGQEDSQLNDQFFRNASCSKNVERMSQDVCASELPSVLSLSDGKEESEHVHLNSVANEVSMENILVMSCSEPQKQVSVGIKKSNKRARNCNSNQRTLASYFQKKPSLNVDTKSANVDISVSQEEQNKTEAESSVFTEEPSSHEGPLMGNNLMSSQQNETAPVPSTDCSTEKEKHNVAHLEWQRIQELMLKRKALPLCKGHHEPCVARIVKKEGPNLGRKFYVCNRSKGPSSNPEARCDYFKWEESGHKKR